MKNKIILAIVGLPGAGKSTASAYLEKKGVPKVVLGDIVNTYIDEHHGQHTVERHVRIWKQLRKKFGKEAFIVLNLDKIKKCLEENDLVVIDGMRSWEEYLLLKSKFPKAKIFILCIFTDKANRYERSAKRKYRPKLYGVERDLDETFGTNMGPTIALADYLISNNGSLKDFYHELGSIFNGIIGKK